MSAEITSPEPPESVVKARESLRLINRWSYGAFFVGLAMLTQASWWVVAAAVFLLVAAVGSIVTMTKLPAAKAHRSEWFFAVALLLACGYFLLACAGQLIFFNETNAYADCINQAVTLSGTSKCNVQLQDSMLGMFIGQ